MRAGEVGGVVVHLAQVFRAPEDPRWRASWIGVHRGEHLGEVAVNVGNDPLIGVLPGGFAKHQGKVPDQIGGHVGWRTLPGLRKRHRWILLVYGTSVARPPRG